MYKIYYDKKSDMWKIYSVYGELVGIYGSKKSAEAEVAFLNANQKQR